MKNKYQSSARFSPFLQCRWRRRLRALCAARKKKVPRKAIVPQALWAVPSAPALAGSWAASRAVSRACSEYPSGLVRVSRDRADRSDHADLSANQIADQFAARAAGIKADLRLTPEQEKNWSGFESAVADMGKRNADHQLAMQAERSQQKGHTDVIDQMREEATFLKERAIDRKSLADAAQPLYASLDDRQKRRFTEELLGLSRWSDSD